MLPGRTSISSAVSSAVGGDAELLQLMLDPRHACAADLLGNREDSEQHAD